VRLSGWRARGRERRDLGAMNERGRPAPGDRGGLSGLERLKGRKRVVDVKREEEKRKVSREGRDVWPGRGQGEGVGRFHPLLQRAASGA